MDAALDRIYELTEQLAAVTIERDAAVALTTSTNAIDEVVAARVEKSIKGLNADVQRRLQLEASRSSWLRSQARSAGYGTDHA